MPAPRLPDGWSVPELVEDVVVADGVALRRAGFSSRGPTGEEVVGAAVEVARSPVDRGRFELLERVSTLEAASSRRDSYKLLSVDGVVVGCSRRPLFPESDVPAQWRYARSNGVAIHDGWRAAALRALWELAERDRVLRAWYGDTRPARVDLPIDDTPLAGASSFDWVAYSFPSPSPENFSAGVEVVGVFGFPDRDTLPVISGFGGRPNWQEAHAAAVSEAMQLLGFLWGEPVAEEAPSCGPTPLHHLDYYQWPPHRAHLRRWLELGHERFLPARLPEPGTPVMFADLTPAWLESGLRVAKAICDSAAPLTFGDSPFACHLPSELRPHPVA